jgi:hypothetical protein
MAFGGIDLVFANQLRFILAQCMATNKQKGC